LTTFSEINYFNIISLSVQILGTNKGFNFFVSHYIIFPRPTQSKTEINSVFIMTLKVFEYLFLNQTGMEKTLSRSSVAIKNFGEARKPLNRHSHQKSRGQSKKFPNFCHC
jgi:hypothetical protein